MRPCRCTGCGVDEMCFVSVGDMREASWIAGGGSSKERWTEERLWPPSLALRSDDEPGVGGSTGRGMAENTISERNASQPQNCRRGTLAQPGCKSGNYRACQLYVLCLCRALHDQARVGKGTVHEGTNVTSSTGNLVRSGTSKSDVAQ